MKKREVKDLKKSIQEKELQLSKLRVHVDKSTICSNLYNKVVLEKAILKKELEDIESNNLLTTVKKFIPRKKTLICDYFKR